MALSYNLGYQEIISVHPTRRQIFAGKPYSNFPNIWEWLIYIYIAYSTRLRIITGPSIYSFVFLFFFTALFWGEEISFDLYHPSWKYKNTYHTSWGYYTSHKHIIVIGFTYSCPMLHDNNQQWAFGLLKSLYINIKILTIFLITILNININMPHPHPHINNILLLNMLMTTTIRRSVFSLRQPLSLPRSNHGTVLLPGQRSLILLFHIDIVIFSNMIFSQE